ncbi:hypothetical protein ACFQ0G_01020 [Streptomyces chiangmaiensis]
MPGSRRSQRQRAVSELRAQGRYGPELRDVLPAFVGLGLAVLAPVLLLVWLYRALGVGGLVLGLVLATAAGTAVIRLRRAVARRRGGHYTAAELARLNDQGLTVAAARMLRRDGWRVVDLTVERGARVCTRGTAAAANSTSLSDPCRQQARTTWARVVPLLCGMRDDPASTA